MRISELPERESANQADYLLIDNSEIGTRKITKANFLEDLTSQLANTPWILLNAGTAYQANAGDKIACYADATNAIAMPASPVLGDDVLLLGINCTNASYRTIAGISKFNGSTPTAVRLASSFNSVRLIYLGSALGWVADRDGPIATTAPAADIPLTFASVGDTNGLVFYLGTNGKAETFSNPHTRGTILMSASSVLSPGAPSVLTDRGASAFYTQNAANSWVKLNIVANFRLRPTHYTWRGRSDFNNNHLRSWRLQISNDDSSWIDADIRTNNTQIAQNTYFSGAVTGVSTFYKYFRLLNTAPDSDGQNYLTGGEWELYGDLRAV